jgi:hypothetical protein
LPLTFPTPSASGSFLLRYAGGTKRAHRQELDRLHDLNHATSLAKIERAFAALGKTLDIAVADAQ